MPSTFLHGLMQAWQSGRQPCPRQRGGRAHATALLRVHPLPPSSRRDRRMRRRKGPLTSRQPLVSMWHASQRSNCPALPYLPPRPAATVAHRNCSGTKTRPVYQTMRQVRTCSPHVIVPRQHMGTSRSLFPSLWVLILMGRDCVAVIGSIDEGAADDDGMVRNQQQ